MMDTETVSVSGIGNRKMTLASLKKVASSYGAKVDVDTEGCYNVNVNLPKGLIWNANGIHTLNSFCYNGNPSWRKDVFKDLIDRMAYGISKCDGINCETCES